MVVVVVVVAVVQWISGGDVGGVGPVGNVGVSGGGGGGDVGGVLKESWPVTKLVVERPRFEVVQHSTRTQRLPMPTGDHGAHYTAIKHP